MLNKSKIRRLRTLAKQLEKIRVESCKIMEESGQSIFAWLKMPTPESLNDLADEHEKRLKQDT